MPIFPTWYTQKSSPVLADKILISDSESSNQTKYMEITDLPFPAVEEAKFSFKTSVTVWFSNADYICDGTDDWVQIQQALTHINSLWGWILFIKEWTYSLTNANPVIIYSNTEVFGTWNSTILEFSQAGADKFSTYTSWATWVENVFVRDLKVDANNFSTSWVVSYYSTNVHFDNVEVVNVPWSTAYWFYMWDCDFPKITNCRCINTVLQWRDAYQFKWCRYWIIENNYATLFNYYGVDDHDSTDRVWYRNIIRNNRFFNNDRWIDAQQSHSIVEWNIIEFQSRTIEGIEVRWDWVGISIINNIITYDKVSITVWAAWISDFYCNSIINRDLVISGNIIENAWANWIQIYKSKKSVISNNVIKNSWQWPTSTKKYGIFMNDSITDNVITWNICYDDQDDWTTSLLASNATWWTATIVVADWSIFSEWDWITISDTAPNSEYIKILTIASNTITTCTNLVNSYTTAASGSIIRAKSQTYWYFEQGAYSADYNIITSNNLRWNRTANMGWLWANSVNANNL